MITQLKYQDDTHTLRVYNSETSDIKQYLTSNQIIVEDVLISKDGSIYIEINEQNPKYRDIFFISKNEIDQLLEIANKSTYYISPNLSSPRSIVLVLK